MQPERSIPRRLLDPLREIPLDVWAGGAIRWTQLAGGAIGGSAIASVLTLVANTVLLRTLPLTDAGRFALLIALLQTVALIGTLGQPGMLLRTYSRLPPAHFNWPRDLSTTAALSMLTVGGTSLVAGVTYGLPMSQILFLAGAGTLVATVASGAQILNSQRYYTWAAVLLRLPYSLMILPAALTLNDRFARLDLMILAQTSCVVVAAGLTGSLLLRRVGRGPAHILPRQRVAGLVFLASLATGLVPLQGLVAIAGALVPTAALAAFAALSLLLRPFVLATGVLQQIFTTELVRGREVNPIRMTAGLGTVSVGAGLIAILAVPPLSNWVYDGRYGHDLGIIPWLTIAGVLGLAESLSRSYVLGRASERILYRFIGAQVVIAATGVGVAIFLTQQHGILGTAIAGTLIYAIRTVVAYGFLWRGERGAPRDSLPAEANSR